MKKSKHVVMQFAKEKRLSALPHEQEALLSLSRSLHPMPGNQNND